MRKRRGRNFSGGFTLIEVMIVAGFIALLAGITLGAVDAARTRAALLRTRAELAVLTEALERFRATHGDYPQTESADAWYEALQGCLRDADIPRRDPLAQDGAANAWVDPWGREYRYCYYTRSLEGGLTSRGFVLFSLGPRKEGETLPTLDEIVPTRSGALGGEVAAGVESGRCVFST